MGGEKGASRQGNVVEDECYEIMYSVLILGDEYMANMYTESVQAQQTANRNFTHLAD